MNIRSRFAASRRRSFRLALCLSSTLSCVIWPGGSAHAGQLAITIAPTPDPTLQFLAIPADAPIRGMWSALQNWPINAITLALMPNGKVASYGTPVANPGTQDGRTYDVWDPSQGFGTAAHTTLPGVTGVNSFCAAQAFQADGSLLISGGIFDAGNDKGSVVLNSTASSVSGIAPTLAADRYYATMITQADGSQVIMGGSYPYLGGSNDPQGSIDKGYMTGMTPEVLRAGAGWSSLFGAKSRDAFGPDYQRWWYPRAWVAPNGQVFGISADNMWVMNTSGLGSVTWMPFRPPQAAASTAAAAPNTGPVSTAAMYDVGKVIQVGGNSLDNFNGYLASSRATTVDINGALPVATDVQPMNFGRAWANSTVLPTGKVVVNGGSLFDNNAGNLAVLATETWDSATGVWSVGPSASVYRGYHSSAILMQDGTVLTAGGGAPGPVNNLNAEIFYPPYLFKTVNGQPALAPRPQIVSLSSTTLGYAQTFQIEATSSTSIASVVLVGVSVTTHSFNSGQRRIPLSYSQSGSIISAHAPRAGAIAPPGYYQLVVIDRNGVPSPGTIVAVGPGVAAPSVTTVPTGVVQTVGSAPAGMSSCSGEYATCTVNGTQLVMFGVNGAYVPHPAANSIACGVGAFGIDPQPGTIKACYVPTSSLSTAPPPPSPAPPPPPLALAVVPNGVQLVACAPERMTCQLTGSQTVYFGAAGRYLSQAATGAAVFCSSGQFGGDPAPGAVKACYTTSPLTLCSAELSTCTVAGTTTVLFGANGVFSSKPVNGSVFCSSGEFGGDPVPGMVKACYIQN